MLGTFWSLFVLSLHSVANILRRLIFYLWTPVISSVTENQRPIRGVLPPEAAAAVPHCD